MKLEIWRHMHNDPDAGEMIHEFECSGFRIDAGVLVLDVDGEPTYLIRTWDWVEIRRAEQSK